MLLSAFAYQAVETERQARLQDRALRLREKGEGLVRELTDQVRAPLRRLETEVAALRPGRDAALLAPEVSRLVAQEPMLGEFILLDPEGRRVYPALRRPARAEPWLGSGAGLLDGPSGALLARDPLRELQAAYREGIPDGEALTRVANLARGSGLSAIRAAALLDLGWLDQRRGTLPGMLNALEAYRELAALPLATQDALGRPAAAEGRLRLALVQRTLRDRTAYLSALRELVAELDQGADALPAEVVAELGEQAAAQLEFEGVSPEVVARARALVARRQASEADALRLEALQALLAPAAAPVGPLPLLQRVREGDRSELLARTPLPHDPAGGPLGRAVVRLDPEVVAHALRERLEQVRDASLAAGRSPAGADLGLEDASRVQTVGLPPPLDDLAVRVQAPPDPPSAVEDALNLPRETAYLWAIALSVSGIAAGVVVTTRTVLREAKAAQLKSDWVANVTHELKTPLTSIRMFIDTLLLERVQDEAEAKECLEVMAREAERLTRLIEQLLAFSRVDSRKWRLKLGFADPRDLVNEAIGVLADQLGLDVDALAIEVVSVQELPAIAVDRVALVEALLNLLHNAWKYSAGPERKVRVVLTGRRRHVEIAVEDNGIGVPARDRRRIFVKFERGTNAEKERIEGSGIGLTVANAIAKAHWGWIEYAPNRPRGSRFLLCLPK